MFCMIARLQLICLCGTLWVRFVWAWLKFWGNSWTNQLKVITALPVVPLLVQMSCPKLNQGEQHWNDKLPVLIVGLKIPAWLDTWWKTSRPLCPGAPLFARTCCVLWHDVILKHTMGRTWTQGKFLITSGLILFPTTVWIGFVGVLLKKKSGAVFIHLQEVAFNFCGFLFLKTLQDMGGGKDFPKSEFLQIRLENLKHVQLQVSNVTGQITIVWGKGKKDCGCDKKRKPLQACRERRLQRGQFDQSWTTFPR